MSNFYASVQQMKKMLTQLEKWIDKAVEYAGQRSFDPNVLLTQRLFVDQYPLVKQIQASCDSPKFFAARVTGKEPPKHPDTEQTIDEIRARLRSVIAYLDTYTPADFASIDGAKQLALPFLEGKTISADDYLTELTYPNFYFHLAHAYAILRHNGVSLGKMDYLGSLTLTAP